MPYSINTNNRQQRPGHSRPIGSRLIRLRQCPSRWALLVFLSLCLSLTTPAPAWALEVLTNANVTDPAINRQMLRAIFSMRLRQWTDGTPITVYVMRPSSPTHIAFCKEVLGVLPHQLQRSWDRLVFSGMGQAPIEVESLDEMRRRVLATPGAIGYLE